MAASSISPSDESDIQESKSSSAVGFPMRYPIAVPPQGCKEVEKYTGEVITDAQKRAKYECARYPDPAQVNLAREVTLIKDILGVDFSPPINHKTNVAEFIAENKEKWLQALQPQSGPIEALQTIGQKAQAGSLLRGVSDTLCYDLIECQKTFLKYDVTQDEALKTFQKMCALLREAKCVKDAQGKGLATLSAKKALMLLKLQNLHTKYDQFSRENGKANAAELHDLSEKLGRFGISDPSIVTKHLFTAEELSNIFIDLLKDSMDILVDTMKRKMSVEEWQTNTSRESGRCKPFAELEQELITDFDWLIQTEIRRTI